MNDLFRAFHPLKRSYTYHSHPPNIVFTRIDLILLSSGLLNKCDSTDIIPGYVSDHSFVTAKLTLEKSKRGNGLWKLNCQHLRDIEYINQIKKVINDTAKINHEANPALLWNTIN